MSPKNLPLSKQPLPLFVGPLKPGITKGKGWKVLALNREPAGTKPVGDGLGPVGNTLKPTGATLRQVAMTSNCRAEAFATMKQPQTMGRNQVQPCNTPKPRGATHFNPATRSNHRAQALGICHCGGSHQRKKVFLYLSA